MKVFITILTSRLEAKLQMPAKKAMCCLGSVAMPSERAKITKAVPSSIWKAMMTIVTAIFSQSANSAGKSVKINPTMEKERKKEIGRAHV